MQRVVLRWVWIISAALMFSRNLLGDPWGGTGQLGGRHPSKMSEPQAAADAPQDVVFLMRGMCQEMPAALRLYGHPEILAVAEAINGDDFCAVQ